jgi:hypothetical protein
MMLQRFASWFLKPRLVLALSTGVLLGVFALVLWFSTEASRHHITWEACKDLRSGMTRSDVEYLFGVPPGDYDELPNDFFDHRPRYARQADWKENRGAPTDWGSNGLIVHTWFNQRQELVHWTFIRWDPEERTLWERIRARLNRTGKRA